nr:MAG TPA: hypothetical protein [Caudoviricetes sp.]
MGDKPAVVDQLKSHKQIGSRSSAKKIVTNHRELTPIWSSYPFLF